MKVLLALMCSLILVSCASKKKNDAYDYKKDPVLTDKAKAELTARRERDLLPLEDIEQMYQEKKREPFYFLGEVLEHALKDENWEKVEKYAKEYEEEALSYRKNWNYGNAIFYSNIAMGRVALHKNDVDSAKKYLKKASKTPGSPQLNSFGPLQDRNVKILILDLLGKGEQKAVLEFLKNCRVFVSQLPKKQETPENSKLFLDVMGINNKVIDHTIQQVQNKEVPDFGLPPEKKK